MCEENVVIMEDTDLHLFKTYLVPLMLVCVGVQMIAMPTDSWFVSALGWLQQMRLEKAFLHVSSVPYSKGFRYCAPLH